MDSYYDIKEDLRSFIVPLTTLIVLSLWLVWGRNHVHAFIDAEVLNTIQFSVFDWVVIFSFAGVFMYLAIHREFSLRRLNESQKKLKAIYEKSNDGIMLTCPDGRILQVNKAGCDILGMDEEEICELGRGGVVVKDELLEAALAIREETGVFSGELTFRHKSGEHIPVKLSSTIFTMPGTKEKRTSLIFRDISQQKQLEDAIQDTLKKRTYLLKEIHHRIKNNLSVVTGLLEIQKMDNPDLEDILGISQNRIQSIADIHSLLYNTNDFSELDMQAYTQKLVNRVVETMQHKTSVDVQLKIDSFRLDVDQAVPLGLLLNELLTNTYKYAFDEYDEAKINIQIQQNGNVIQFAYSDNGVGIPKSADSSDDISKNSLGFELIEVLSQQLSADQIEMKVADGFSYSFRFMASHTHKW